jgi:hypothetical protein
MCCFLLHFWKQQEDSVTMLAHSLKRQICRCLCVDYLAGGKIGSNLPNHLYIMLKQMTCWSSNRIIRDSIIIVYGGLRWSVHRHWHPCCYCCHWSCGCFYLVLQQKLHLQVCLEQNQDLKTQCHGPSNLPSDV